MTSRVACIFAGLILTVSPVAAQIAPMNAAGVSAAHEHFRAVDVDAAERFWTSLGGTRTPAGMIRAVKFPGIFIMVSAANDQNPVKGGTDGSTVAALRFKVKNLKNTVSTMEAAGYKPLPNARAGTAEFMAPHDAKVQVVEVPSLATPIASDALVMTVPDVENAAAWYAKWFGAKVVKRDGATYADIPGVTMRFEAAKGPVAGTRGRALDHIGFEVTNLEARMKTLADGGVQITTQFRPAPDAVKPVRTIGLVTDPWGTTIELNEGFADIK